MKNIKVFVEQNPNSDLLEDTQGNVRTKKSIGFHYGECPNYIMPDKEGLDFFILVPKVELPLKGTWVQTQPVGYINFTGKDGIYDPKVIAVYLTPEYGLFEGMEDAYITKSINEILTVYLTRDSLAQFIVDPDLNFLQLLQIPVGDE